MLLKRGNPTTLLAIAWGVCLLFGLGAHASSEPVAYWAFDEDFTATAGDSAFNGVPLNGSTIDPTRSRFGGAAARFRRFSEQSIHVAQSPFTGQSYTYAGWYYLDVSAIAGSDRYMVLEASDGATWPASLGLRWTGSEQAANVFSHDNGTTGATPQITLPSGPHRTWRHVAVTYDAETLRLEVFLDGAGAGMFLLRSDATELSPSTYMNIGSHRGPTGRTWEGWIDEVAVWDRVLSQKEIRLLQELPPNAIGNVGIAGYHKWIGGFEIPQGAREPTVDANGDGIRNLAKYAFGLHPLEAGELERLPAMVIQEEGEESYIVMEIHRNPQALGLDIVVESSADLKAWEPADVVVLEDEPDFLRMRIEDNSVATGAEAEPFQKPGVSK